MPTEPEPQKELPCTWLTTLVVFEIIGVLVSLNVIAWLVIVAPR